MVDGQPELIISFSALISGSYAVCSLILRRMLLLNRGWMSCTWTFTLGTSSFSSGNNLASASAISHALASLVGHIVVVLEPP